MAPDRINHDRVTDAYDQLIIELFNEALRKAAQIDPKLTVAAATAAFATCCEHAAARYRAWAEQLR